MTDDFENDDLENDDSDFVEGPFFGDIEPLCEYLQGRLSPERAAEMRHRLETDAAFLEWAAPLILAWRAPVKRPRRSREELERHWAKFCKRVGFSVPLFDEPRKPATGD